MDRRLYWFMIVDRHFRSFIHPRTMMNVVIFVPKGSLQLKDLGILQWSLSCFALSLTFSMKALWEWVLSEEIHLYLQVFGG